MPRTKVSPVITLPPQCTLLGGPALSVAAGSNQSCQAPWLSGARLPFQKLPSRGSVLLVPLLVRSDVTGQRHHYRFVVSYHLQSALDWRIYVYMPVTLCLAVPDRVCSLTLVQ